MGTGEGLQRGEVQCQVESHVSGLSLGPIKGKTYGSQERRRGICRVLSDLKATISHSAEPQTCLHRKMVTPNMTQDNKKGLCQEEPNPRRNSVLTTFFCLN